VTLGSKFQVYADTNKSSNRAPDFRIFVGSIKVGGAGQRTVKESGRDDCSIKLDDPAFAAPLYASLVKIKDSKTFNLLWSRRGRD
jgi:uncharacterized protein (DUF736 family)